MMVSNILRGDIFYIKSGMTGKTGSEQGANRPAIIVSNNTGNYYAPVVEVVYLTTKEKKPMPTHANVMCSIPSVALCEQVHTISKERLGEYIRSCNNEEMDAIDKALIVSLGLYEPNKQEEENHVLEEMRGKLAECEEELERTREENKRLQAKDEESVRLRTETAETIERLTKERNLLKQAPQENTQEEIRILENKNAVLEREKDFYKAQYESLIDRILSK